MIELEAAKAKDCSLFFFARCDDEAVRMSTSRKPLDWETHNHWYVWALASGSEELFVLVNEAGVKLGTARISYSTDGLATISLALLSEFRGKGHGQQVIELLLGRIRATGYQPRAVVRRENIGSLIAFLKAGMQPAGEFVEFVTVQGD